MFSLVSLCTGSSYFFVFPDTMIPLLPWLFILLNATYLQWPTWCFGCFLPVLALSLGFRSLYPLNHAAPSQGTSVSGLYILRLVFHSINISSYTMAVAICVLLNNQSILVPSSHHKDFPHSIDIWDAQAHFNLQCCIDTELKIMSHYSREKSNDLEHPTLLATT